MSLPSGFSKLHALLARIGTALQSPFLLVMRLYWGWQFFQTGKSHLMNLEKTTAFFTDLGIPAPKLNVIMAGGTECVGGLLLLLGFCSRVISVPLMFTMIVAYATADKEAAQVIFSDPDKFVSASPFLFLLTAVIVLLFGPGKFSVDGLILKIEPASSH
jgi:putative oxidoreductase